MPVEGAHTGRASGALHVQTLEGTGGNPSGGAVLPATVPELRHANVSSVDGSALTDGQVQPDNEDANVAARHEAVSEGGRDRV